MSIQKLESSYETPTSSRPCWILNSAKFL